MTLLFKTKLRKKLLAYLFTHSGERFYVRELAGLINDDAGNLSRELRTLEKEGLCISTVKGRLRFYSLNKNYPLFGELKQIVFKTEGVAGILKDTLEKTKGVHLAFIYGSYANDKENNSSDIDFLVVGNVSRNEFTRHIRALESKINREINFTIYTQEEFEKEKNKEGGFLNLVLKGKTIMLKGRSNVG